LSGKYQFTVDSGQFRVSADQTTNVKHQTPNSERGTVLLTAIIILTFLAVLGMSLIAFLFSRVSYSQLQLDRLKALYLAEAGIFKAIWELRFDIDPDGDGQGNISKTELGDGYFWTRHNFQSSTLTSTGEVNKIRRVVQLKYSPI